jgi:DNA-binding Lrp family transcriptional regulator|tara:strand:- start:180 stop:428 length:249 start_codon:yes stop_codon:yes gene_type:complete
MPIAYVLINSELGTDTNVISRIKEILTEEQISSFEIQGVYGVFDIVLKISSDDEKLRNMITNKIRKITQVQSTLTMMVIDKE